MSRTKKKPEKVFVLRATVSGGLSSNYVFESNKEFEAWKNSEFIALTKKYGNLTLRTEPLPGFKIGDTCCVQGEGMDTFVIKGLKQYSPNRYGFLLDSGWCEEVAKCFSPSFFDQLKD